MLSFSTRKRSCSKPSPRSATTALSPTPASALRPATRSTILVDLFMRCTAPGLLATSASARSAIPIPNAAPGCGASPTRTGLALQLSLRTIAAAGCGRSGRTGGTAPGRLCPSRAALSSEKTVSGGPSMQIRGYRCKPSDLGPRPRGFLFVTIGLWTFSLYWVREKVRRALFPDYDALP